MTTTDPRAKASHDFTTVGPGVPACTCGEIFEWKYEQEDHKWRHEGISR